MKIFSIVKLTSRLSLIFFWVLFSFLYTSCEENDEKTSEMIRIDSDQLSFELEAEDTSISLSFAAMASWSAKVKNSDNTSWISLPVDRGIGGMIDLKILITMNTSQQSREAFIVLTCGTIMKEIKVIQSGTSLRIMNESDISDFHKYYKPKEFDNINMFRDDSKWSWFRCKQSEHFFVFWEGGFGEDPNGGDVPENLRVDIDDLLVKAEQFYRTNVEKLKFVEVGQGKSYLDKYKMQIYLLYQEEWLATGAGYDNVIGALWVNPSTCHPVGSTIAHEIGHCFQYQVYCDKLLQGVPDDLRQGFRYGYEGINGGNGFWEQCAQWQSYQDYPEQMFSNHDFEVWTANYHRHFEHEWMRYASYWLQSYWAQKHGMGVIGEIWKQSTFPEDAIGAYMRLYCDGEWTKMRNELYDYAARMATFDIDVIRDYSLGYSDKYATTLYGVEDDYYQVAYASCPGTTGFNVIQLNVPVGEKTVSANFKGLAPGSLLAPDDPGEYKESEVIQGVTNTYNAGVINNAGWCYGFVALKTDGTRVYSGMGQGDNMAVHFTIPDNTDKLYFVVLGAPKQYKSHPWDEKEINDEQWPYKVKFIETDLFGNLPIDKDVKPENVSFSYRFNCNAEEPDYKLGAIDLASNGDLRKLAQAFVMQPSELKANTLSISNGNTALPVEGKIVLGLSQPDASSSFTYTADAGFYCTAEGYNGSWSKNDPVWVEYDKDTFTFRFGHKPGYSLMGTEYIIKPSLFYMKNGKQYRATFVIHLQF